MTESEGDENVDARCYGDEELLHRPFDVQKCNYTFCKINLKFYYIQILLLEFGFSLEFLMVNGEFLVREPKMI